MKGNVMDDKKQIEILQEDLECALEDMAYWTAKNMHTVPLIFRNDQVQEQYCELVKEFRSE